MDPERQIAQLGQGGLGLLGCPIQAASDFRVAIVTELAPRDLQLEGQRHEPLLGAVVEVPLDALPLAIAGLDDPRARRANLAELRLDLGGQPIVLDRQPHRAGDRGHRGRARRAGSRRG